MSTSQERKAIKDENQIKKDRIQGCFRDKGVENSKNRKMS